MKRTREEQIIYEALSAVETPPWDAEGAVLRALERPRGRRSRPVPRALLAAACLAAALAVGAAAVGLSGAWRYFFAALPAGAVETVGVSRTAGDYTLTVMDAVPDENGVLLLLSLTRADGGDIDPLADISTYTLHADVKAEESGGAGSLQFSRPRLSEDGKTLYITCERTAAASLPGQALTLTAPGVAQELGDEYGRADLAGLAGVEVPDLSGTMLRETAAMEELLSRAVEAQDVSIPIATDGGFKGWYVLGAAVTEEGLAVLTSGGKLQQGDLACADFTPEALVDTRTGVRYEYPRGHGYALSGGGWAMVWSFPDCPLTPADLPWLRLEVWYQVDRILSEEPFSVPFTVGGGASMRLPLDWTLEEDGVRLHATELNLSALRVSVSFAEDADTSGVLYRTGTAPVITLEDGTQLQTVWGGGGDRGDTSTVEFQLKDGAGERIFLDTGRIVSVSFGGNTITIK